MRSGFDDPQFPAAIDVIYFEAVACHAHGTTLRGFLPRAWVLARIL